MLSDCHTLNTYSNFIADPLKVQQETHCGIAQPCEHDLQYNCTDLNMSKHLL